MLSNTCVHGHMSITNTQITAVSEPFSPLCKRALLTQVHTKSSQSKGSLLSGHLGKAPELLLFTVLKDLTAISVYERFSKKVLKGLKKTTGMEPGS